MSSYNFNTQADVIPEISKLFWMVILCMTLICICNWLTYAWGICFWHFHIPSHLQPALFFCGPRTYIAAKQTNLSLYYCFCTYISMISLEYMCSCRPISVHIYASKNRLRQWCWVQWAWVLDETNLSFNLSYATW